MKTLGSPSAGSVIFMDDRFVKHLNDVYGKIFDLSYQLRHNSVCWSLNMHTGENQLFILLAGLLEYIRYELLMKYHDYLSPDPGGLVGDCDGC